MLFRKRAKRTRRIRKLRLLALLLVLFLLAGASFSVGLITAIAGQLPNLDPKRAQAGEVDGYIYADNGKTILAVLRGSEARELVEWNDISPWMKHAIVDVEDDASTSTTASTCTASCAPSGQTSGTRAPSKAARRSLNSS